MSFTKSQRNLFLYVDYVVFDARYKIDEDRYNAFIEQGYTVMEEHKGKILILQKGE